MARTMIFRQFLRALQKACQANLAAEKQIKSRESHSYSRRRFIKSATLASGTALITSTLSQWQKALGTNNLTIVVIGGGIAGLNAAYQLKKANLRATVYEARNRLGGRIRSATGLVGKGLVTDLGGSFINTDHEDVLALVKEFNLELFNRDKNTQQFPFPETGYYFDGRLRSEEELAQQLRPLAAQISRDASLLDNNYDHFAPKFDRLSVAAYLDIHAGKIPEPWVRTLIENSIRSEYGVEPKDSSALQLLFNLPTVKGKEVEVLGASDEEFVVKGGSGLIIESLVAALEGQIETGRRLTKIRSSHRGFRLTFAGGEEVEADKVIMAIPFTVLKDVEIEVNLPFKLQRFIKEVTLGSNEKLIAGFDTKFWQQSYGFVEEAWTDLGFSAVWDETQRQPARQDGALTFFFGGEQVKAIESGSALTQGKKILNQFNLAIQGAQNSSNGMFLRTAWTKNSLTRGGYTNFKPGQLTEFGEFLYIESSDPSERQDVRVGNLIFAGEHLSDEFYGYMNGAAQTGRLAAELIIREA